MQGWETGLVRSMHGIDDPGFLPWAGRISQHKKPGAHRAAVMQEESKQTVSVRAKIHTWVRV